MADFLETLFGSAPNYSSVMSLEQTQQMNNNALAQGGIQALVALLGASGKQRNAPSTGQALAGALGAGYGGYQQSFDNTLKQLLTSQQLGEYKQKQDARQRYQEMLKGATSMQPVGTGLTQTGAGSQAQMLAEQTAGFGQEGIDATLRSLQSNVNLPQKRALDLGKLQEAAMMYAAETDPLKLLELSAKTDKSTGNVGQYQDAIKAGIIPKDTTFPQFLKLTSEGKGTNITLNAGDTELSKLQAKQIDALSGTVNSSRRAASTAESIASVLEGKGSGELVKIGANTAQFLGLPSETANANALAQALQTSAATQVRAAGSGSTSDLEFKSFLSVFPSLGNSEDGRKLMAGGLRAFANRDALIEKKAMELFEKKQYSAGALAEYDASLGPVLDPKKFQSLTPSGNRDFRTPAKPKG